ncbi:MAG: hypothetical protein ABSF24_09720 [Candidatus Bathyarchaeia archaeon]|jgi:hypothetical protein
MSRTKRVLAKLIVVAVVGLAIFLLSYFAGFGLLISITISSLSFPFVLAALFPSKAFNFFERHLQAISIAFIIALPGVLTVLLGGFLGVLLLYYVPILFILAAPLLALILTEVGVILIYRVMIHEVVKEERCPVFILRTRKMLNRIAICIFAAFLSLPFLIYLLGYLGVKQPILPLLYLYAFVFWSYFFLLPISLGIVNNYKQVKLGLRAAIGGFEKLTQYSTPVEKSKTLSDLVWLMDSLRVYSKLMSSQPNRPVLTNVKVYYDAAVVAVLSGTRKDQRRTLEALKDMLEALGKKKSEVNFKEFLFALIRMTKTERVTSNDVEAATKTESRTEWIKERSKSIVKYVVPVVSVVVQILAALWAKG